MNLPGGKRQRGQVMYLGFFVALLAITSLYLLYHSTRLSNEKIRVVNAADAAALSGGVWVARQMNFVAYTNRAMVANTVFQGHYTAYVSHMRVIRAGVKIVNDFLQGIPVVGQISTVIDSIVDGFQWFVEFVGIPIVGMVELGNALLFSNQYIATHGLLRYTEEIMEDVGEGYAGQGSEIIIEGPDTGADTDVPEGFGSLADDFFRDEGEMLPRFVDYHRPGEDAGRFKRVLDGTITSLGNSDKEEDVRQYNWITTRPHPDLAFPNFEIPTDPLEALGTGVDYAKELITQYMAGLAAPFLGGPAFAEFLMGEVDKPSAGSDLISFGGISETEFKTGNFIYWETGDGGIFGIDTPLSKKAESTEFGLIKQAVLGYASLNGLVTVSGSTGDFHTDIAIGNVKNYLEPVASAGPSVDILPNLFQRKNPRQLVISAIAELKLAESVHDVSDGETVKHGELPTHVYASSRALVFYQHPDDPNGDADCEPEQLNTGSGLQPNYPDCFANLFNPYWTARLTEGPFDIYSIEPVETEEPPLMPYSRSIPGTTE